jgi:hypothetical protein
MEQTKSPNEIWWESLTEEDKNRMEAEGETYYKSLTDAERNQRIVWKRISVTGSSE